MRPVSAGKMMKDILISLSFPRSLPHFDSWARPRWMRERERLGEIERENSSCFWVCLTVSEQTDWLGRNWRANLWKWCQITNRGKEGFAWLLRLDNKTKTIFAKKKQSKPGLASSDSLPWQYRLFEWAKHFLWCCGGHWSFGVSCLRNSSNNNIADKLD